MKIRMIIPFVICIMMTIGSAGAVWGSSSETQPDAAVLESNSYKQLVRMNELADSLYNAAFINNRQAGYVYVQQLQGLLAGDLAYSADMHKGWAVMYDDAEVIKKTLMNGSGGSEWLKEAARLKLASDALIRPEHALWLQYESVMLDDLSRVEKGWKRQTGDGSEAARAAMNSLQEHAQRIEPAYVVLYGSMHGAELQERIRYMNQLLDTREFHGTHDKMINEALNALKVSIIRLYDVSGRIEVLQAVTPPASASPMKWIFFLGAVISAVLTYTGWRKYKSDPFGVKPLT